MNAQQRRQAILEHLDKAGAPVTGGALARIFSVSRQVIVQDVALLRAKGADILPTAGGYLLQSQAKKLPSRVFACRHLGLEELARELNLVVDCGGMVRDVIVEHPVYGELRGVLMLGSRRRVAEFVGRPCWNEASPLSVLTRGVHLHTVEADSVEDLDAIEGALREGGLLLE